MSHAPVEVTIVSGPTASGKSDFALGLARARRGVVINADAMQTYDALPILTARPGIADMAEVPHRLFGVFPPDQACTARLWRDSVITEIHRSAAMGLHPVVCGGSGFYIAALVEGLSPIPDIPVAIRAHQKARQEQLGNPAFHQDLARRDPVMAERLHPQDTQRLVRAAEVLEATGRSLAYWQSLPREMPPPDFRFHLHLLNPDPDSLAERIDSRFDAMLDSGALEEVAELGSRIDSGAIPPDAPVVIAHGFRPLRAYLRGELSLEEAAHKARLETRHYAKRQRTWWRARVRHPAFSQGCEEHLFP